MKSGNIISIIGTGDFGRALAKSSLQAGYAVVFGSRHPESRNPATRDPALAEAKVCAIEEAIQASNVIFLAIHTSAHDQLKVFQQELQGKILVDVSNVNKANAQESNAERLQKMFPESHVVKAFNTLSAYTLMTGHSTASKDVYIAGDDDVAVQTVMDVARQMGFNAVARGKLPMARDLEAMNARLFTGWGTPLIVACVTMASWLTYATVRTHIIKGGTWNNFALQTVSKCLGTTAITLLALCYLPGSIAAFVQIRKGTKHLPFSPFLDRWLRMRKQLGLIALWSAAAHCIYSLPQVNPGYYSKWFPNNEYKVPANQTQDLTFSSGLKMDWIGECAVACGALGVCTMSILGVASLPSVGALMNWKQWRFVQSYIGYFCLAVSASHVSFITCPGWSSKTFVETIQGMGFLSVQLPYFTLFMRLLLLLPCLSIPLKKIRQGWERGTNNDMEAGNKISPQTNGHKNAAFEVSSSTSKL